jgi:hypothetical protein
MEKIKVECDSCGGTGLYCGICEPKGAAVVCLGCDGTGCREIQYEPFTVRKERKGIRTVQRSRGSFIASGGCGGYGKSITYEEFRQGKMP